MISKALLDAARCPDCGQPLRPAASPPTCGGCGRAFDTSGGYLDLRPAAEFAERTKYLDEALHVDGRHESIAPPVLGSKVRNDMLRKFLALGPEDRAIDLGCGNGRAIAWNAPLGASMLGIDISPHFAAEAIATSDLVLGDLRRLPLAAGTFNKAWSLDVLEHLSPQAFRDVLTEACRVLTDDGRLFIYTHVRKNGWPAAGVRLVNRMARGLERVGLIDLRQERLRKSDHLNPIADHDELARVVAECGLRIERVTYYTPVVGALAENIVARVVEHALARRAAGRGQSVGDDAVKAARRSAQQRVRRRGLIYRCLLVTSAAMKLDLLLFGHIRSGPFFALLGKAPAGQHDGPVSARPAP